jgi:type IV pilus assembly protein PilB
MATDTSSIEDLLSDKGKEDLTGKKVYHDDEVVIDSKKKVPQKEDESSGSKLSKKLKTIDESDEETKAKQKADELGIPYIDLTGFPVSNDSLQTITEKESIDNSLIAFVNTGAEIRMATTDPENKAIEAITHRVEEALHADVKLYLISERNLKKRLEQYSKVPKYVKPVSGVEVSEEELKEFQEIAKDFTALQAHIKKVNITDMVTLIIAASIQSGASDIHIEAEEEDVRIRFRVDGILHDAAEIERKHWPKIISRIKLLAGVKLNITSKPQDGRISIKMSSEKIDVRVSTLPTTWGESVVMRLLKSSTASLEFQDLGLMGKAFEDLKREVERPNGMIITTGPTGSGKTTTLYAILNKLNIEGTKVITLEDPVEYKLKGINQSQIDHSKDYTFADGLRSILRQDPDVVMVGEMRDLETSDVAINAALTGHLVISTIHTNSAAGAVPRFLAMNVKPFLLAPALNAIIGQRLVRRVCEGCKEEVTLEEPIMAKVKDILGKIPEAHPDRPDMENLKFVKGKGCDTCHGIGFKGRIGIYEIMSMTKEIETIILGGKVSEYDMQEIGVKNNMLTMAQDGIVKALKGITSIDEVFRVSE